MEITMETLGKKISELRNAMGMSQEQLSAKSKVARRTIQNIEGGKVMSPGVEVIAAIAKVLNTSVSDIIGDKPVKSSKSDLILAIQASLTTLDHDQLKDVKANIEGGPKKQASDSDQDALNAFIQGLSKDEIKYLLNRSQGLIEAYRNINKPTLNKSSKVKD
ncbi:MAG: helix-turn-helix transcriptional regulator [Bdellovibrionaceae bacterium]|nr:helix-turn-helix transcriptional regulator [Pseudobdellovibrionaceae bacterium]